MKACIFSGKYNASHNSFIFAMKEIFDKIGYETYILADDEYITSFSDSERKVGNFITLKNFSKTNISFDVLYIINQSKIDLKIIKKLRKENRLLKVFFACHEPWEGWKLTLKKLFKRKEGLNAVLKIIFKYFLSKNELKLVDYTILFSKAGYDRFEKHLKKYAHQFFLMQLPFLDENNIKENSSKNVLSFIGSTALAHNFEGYVDLILEIFKISNEMNFLIATKDNLTSTVLNKLQPLIDANCLQLKFGKVMSNDEINYFYGNSTLVWLFYNASVQSGVLCKSFMFGAPVLANDIGSFRQFIQDGVNGFLVGDVNANKVIKIMRAVNDNRSTFFMNCRKTYDLNFNYLNQIEKFREILNGHN